MKVLSVRQPFADWIVDGKKTIELRTWNTPFRGEFFVHASGKHEKLLTGAIIGVAELVDVIEYADEGEFLRDRKKHLCDCWLIPEFASRPFKYGFVLRNARRITPVKARGALGFWDYGSRCGL